MVVSTGTSIALCKPPPKAWISSQNWVSPGCVPASQATLCFWVTSLRSKSGGKFRASFSVSHPIIHNRAPSYVVPLEELSFSESSRSPPRKWPIANDPLSPLANLTVLQLRYKLHRSFKSEDTVEDLWHTEWGEFWFTNKDTELWFMNNQLQLSVISAKSHHLTIPTLPVKLKPALCTSCGFRGEDAVDAWARYYFLTFHMNVGFILNHLWCKTWWVLFFAPCSL